MSSFLSYFATKNNKINCHFSPAKKQVKLTHLSKNNNIKQLITDNNKIQTRNTSPTVFISHVQSCIIENLFTLMPSAHLCTRTHSSWTLIWKWPSWTNMSHCFCSLYVFFICVMPEMILSKCHDNSISLLSHIQYISLFFAHSVSEVR